MQLLHRHLDEVEFLLTAFEAALDAPHYCLEQVAAGPERRLSAHVDALLVAGPEPCRRLLLPISRDPEAEPARVAAAALVLAELPLLAVPRAKQRSSEPDVLAALRQGGLAPAPAVIWAELLELHDACGDPALRAGMLRGLRLSASEGLGVWIRAQPAVARGPALAARIELLTDALVLPEGLEAYLFDEHPEVARAAARAASLSREHRHLAGLSKLGSSPHPAVQEAAIESALIHYVPGSWASALYWAFTDEGLPFRARALLWVALLGDAEVHGWLVAQLEHEDRRADALWALGFCGRVAAVDAALEWLDDGEHGRLAAEVVTAIAGLSPNEAGCWRPVPEPSEAEALPVLAADPLDAELAVTGADALPWPEPAGIQRWWRARRDHFEARLRHLAGRPATSSRLVELLATGPARRRHGLALELAFRSAGQIRLRTRQTTVRQRAELARLPDLELLDLQRGLRRG